MVATHHRDTQVIHKISPHPLSAVNLGPNQAFEVQEQGKEQSNSLTSACPKAHVHFREAAVPHQEAVAGCSPLL